MKRLLSSLLAIPKYNSGSNLSQIERCLSIRLRVLSGKPARAKRSYLRAEARNRRAQLPLYFITVSSAVPKVRNLSWARSYCRSSPLDTGDEIAPAVHYSCLHMVKPRARARESTRPQTEASRDRHYETARRDALPRESGHLYLGVPGCLPKVIEPGIFQIFRRQKNYPFSIE